MKNITIPLIVSAALLGILPAPGDTKSPTKRSAVESRERASSRIDPHFQSARRKFDAEDLDGCVSELRNAAAKIRDLASGATLAPVEGLNTSVAGLRGVAGDLIGGAGTVVEGTGTVLKKSLGLITSLCETIKGEAKPSSGNLGKDAVDGSRKVSGGAVRGAGKIGEAGAGAVEKTGGGLKKVGDKVSGKE